jgi:transcriptional regulator with XRE-family HTH domain
MRDDVARVERVEFNEDQFFKDVDRTRTDAQISWRELGRRLDISPSTFSRLAQGRRPDVETFLRLLDWMGRSADAYLTGSDRSKAPSADALSEAIEALRGDASLGAEGAAAIEDILRVAYRRFSSPN